MFMTDYRGVLVVLALVGAGAVVVAPQPWMVVWVMLLAYGSNASYSLVSRSAVRNSELYHAAAIVVNNLLFYSVLHELFARDLTLMLFVPYTVATVYGSFTGAKASMVVERCFGITTSLEEKRGGTSESRRAKLILLVLVGLLAMGTLFSDISSWTAVSVAALIFADGVIFSVVRRSRNTSNVAYHVIAFSAKSAVWFLLFRNLAASDMAFGYFAPFMFGSVLGGVTGQRTSQIIEKLLGASPDEHLQSGKTHFMPIGWMALLSVIGLGGLALSVSPLHAAGLLLLAGAQNVAFTLVSRSRNRANMTYHVIASIFSNSVWFLTFRQLEVQNWTLDLYVPYAAGGVMGSIAGVGAAMQIERALQITSDE